MDVFHEPDASLPEHDVEAALLNALRPLGDASNKSNINLNPTTAGSDGVSPTKSDSSPLRPMQSNGLANVKISPPQQPVFTDSPQKNGNFYHNYLQNGPVPQKPLYSQFPSAQSLGKENAFQGGSYGDLSAMPFPESDYGYKAPMKRTMSEMAPSSERPSSKKQKQKFEEEEPFELPDPKDMPSLTDDGSKPSYSYATLIGMAILRAQNRRLTLAQIYKWISDNFVFYRLAESGWQNSIRHNLSLNKNFIKIERPKDDPGKGNYWAIKPGQERPFLQDKKNPVQRRITNTDGSQYLQSLPQEFSSSVYRPSTAPAIGQFTLAPNPVKKTESKAIDSAKFPDESEILSSDGTIPASDPALGEDENDVSTMPPPPAPMRSSPPPQEFGSSPPPMAIQSMRKGTPPPPPRFNSHRRTTSRGQKSTGMNDSGYWSSIESSVARGGTQLTSEADASRSRIRKGRAEAEIARIRSSSFDSPTKDRRDSRPTISRMSSSPTRPDADPLTPAVVFKRPVKPPMSVSPNTNLRNHRNKIRALLGSPAKSFSPLPEAGTWSPAFNLTTDDGATGFTPFVSPFKAARTPWKPCFGNTPKADENNVNSSSHLFDVFIDGPEEDLTSRGSPEKRSAHRPSLTRAATSSGVLADITGSAKSNNITLAPSANSTISPFLNKPNFGPSPAKRKMNALGSPLRQSHTASSGTPEADDFWSTFAPEGLPDEPIARPQTTAPTSSKNTVDNNKDAATLFGLETMVPSDGSEEAIDLFQDFGKIGGGMPAMPAAGDRSTGSPVRKSEASKAMPPPARPGLARSWTSRW